MAVGIKGNEHILEFNEVHNVCRETGDVGAIYMGRDWTERGNIIRFNFFHDIYTAHTHGARIVYLDDFASGTTVFGNIFYNVQRGVFVGGGRDNTVENNVFVGCKQAVDIDARGLGWASKSVGKGGGLRSKLKRVPYRFPPWSVHYPQLIRILDDQPEFPKGNIIRRNLHMGGVWCRVPESVKPYQVFEDNLTDGDPGFVSPGKRDFELRKDSPAFQLGFKRIPIEKIGIYIDELRSPSP